jgi:hypothetical protein
MKKHHTHDFYVSYDEPTAKFWLGLNIYLLEEVRPLISKVKVFNIFVAGLLNFLKYIKAETAGLETVCKPYFLTYFLRWEWVVTAQNMSLIGNLFEYSLSHHHSPPS